MPSPRVVRTSAVEASVSPAAASGCFSAEAGATAGSLPVAPLSATGGGAAANGSSANRDRKRPASADDCRDVAAPPGSVVLAPAPGRHIADGSAPAPAAGPDTAADDASFPSRSAGNKRRGPPKKRICSDLATAAAMSAPAPVVEAAAAAAGISAGERAFLGCSGGATANPMNASLGVANYAPQVHVSQQHNNIQPSPPSRAMTTATTTANYFPSGRLDSLDQTLMRNTIADLSLPFSSSVGALAAPHLSSVGALPPHLLLMYQQQLYGYPTLHDHSMVRAMSTAAALGEIEAHHELALARARAWAHQEVASAPVFLPHHAQQPQVTGGRADGADIDYDSRKHAPATVKNHNEVQVADRPIAGASSAGKDGKSSTTNKSCGDGTSLQSDTEPIKNEQPPPPATAPRKGPKKTFKKKVGTSDGGKRPRVAATQSIFPQTNTNTILLSHSGDGDLLSPYLCIIRKQIEIFVSTPEDIKAKLSVGGNKIPPVAGQIGLRCIHCKHVPFRHRAKSSESYPNLLKNIHQSVRNYQRHHWPNCKEIPEEVRKEVEACLGSKLSKSKGNAGQWWIRSCRDRGLFDTEEVEFLDETKKTGIFLVGVRDRPESEKPSKIQHVKEAKKGSKTTERSKSSTSIPKTMAKSSPAAVAPPSRSGLDVLLAATGVADRADSVNAVSASAAIPAAEVLPMQPTSDTNDTKVPSTLTPAAGAIATLQHECIHPLLPSTQALAPDSQIHPKVWFTQNVVRMLGERSNREIIDLEGANIVVRESSRLQRELLPIYFGATFTLTTFELLLTSLGFHVSSFSDNKQVFTLTEASADIVKILTGSKAGDES